MTTRLFDEDSHIRHFTGRVISCEQRSNGTYEVELDRTAFFPEGGGQCGDRGCLGGFSVLDTIEKDRTIFHILTSPLAVGQEVHGEIDWDLRFANMQGHSGEHIISGIVHKMFGFSNVGFHIGEQVTLDFNGELSPDDIARVESLANDAVYSNLSVTARYPSQEELTRLEYRSKLELTENVRIVTIDGIDVCACCAPHVSRTGEIGIIKITDSMRHRGGTRLFMLAGRAAYLDYKRKTDSAAQISAMLSAKRDELPSAVERVMSALEDAKRRINDMELSSVRKLADSYAGTDGCICIVENISNPAAARELCNLLSDKCAAVGVFTPSDEGGYRYIICSRRIDLREAAGEINSSINGRGGGKPSMIQGSCTSSKEEIKSFFTSWLR